MRILYFLIVIIIIIRLYVFVQTHSMSLFCEVGFFVKKEVI